MALIKCLECNKEISDKASMCPNCGYPLSKIVKGGQVRIKIPNSIVQGWGGLSYSRKAIIKLILFVGLTLGLMTFLLLSHAQNKDKIYKINQPAKTKDKKEKITVLSAHKEPMLEVDGDIVSGNFIIVDIQEENISKNDLVSRALNFQMMDLVTHEHKKIQDKYIPYIIKETNRKNEVEDKSYTVDTVLYSNEISKITLVYEMSIDSKIDNLYLYDFIDNINVKLK